MIDKVRERASSLDVFYFPTSIFFHFPTSPLAGSRTLYNASRPAGFGRSQALLFKICGTPFFGFSSTSADVFVLCKSGIKDGMLPTCIGPLFEQGLLFLGRIAEMPYCGE